MHTAPLRFASFQMSEAEIDVGAREALRSIALTLRPNSVMIGVAAQ